MAHGRFDTYAVAARYVEPDERTAVLVRIWDMAVASLHLVLLGEGSKAEPEGHACPSSRYADGGERLWVAIRLASKHAAHLAGFRIAPAGADPRRGRPSSAAADDGASSDAALRTHHGRLR